MKLAACAALVVALAGVVSACASAPSPSPSARAGGVEAEVVRIDDELVARKIVENAYVVTHEPFFVSNTLVVRMPDGAVVICSSPFETRAARALVQWVRDTFRPSRVVAINTHFHFDGTGGNEAYRELGVETWGTALTQSLLLEKGASLQAASAEDFTGERRARILAMKVLPAEHTFAEEKEHVLRFGDAEVRVIEPGAAHSADNVLVWFPSIGVLFGGCMIKGFRSVGFIGHADLDHWEAAVDVARRTNPRHVVPGHGAVGGAELFDLTVDVVRGARSSRR
jgi:glyoxylase-like metal-dependent hydrolase (beta-lactamase superfamily II)